MGGNRPPDEGQTPQLSLVEPESTCVYRFYDDADRLLYVGMTAKGHQRTRAHAKEKNWWPQVARSSVEHFKSREDARQEELIAIEYEQPIHNVMDRKPEPMLGVGLRVMHVREDFVEEIDAMYGRLHDLVCALDGEEGFSVRGEPEAAKALEALRTLVEAENDQVLAEGGGKCPACLGARSVQVGGPDEFGNIDYDDCRVCT